MLHLLLTSCINGSLILILKFAHLYKGSFTNSKNILKWETSLTSKTIPLLEPRSRVEDVAIITETWVETSRLLSLSYQLYAKRKKINTFNLVSLYHVLLFKHRWQEILDSMPCIKHEVHLSTLFLAPHILFYICLTVNIPDQDTMVKWPY